VEGMESLCRYGIVFVALLWGFLTGDSFNLLEYPLSDLCGHSSAGGTRSRSEDTLNFKSR
jgi:hypothetical protein